MNPNLTVGVDVGGTKIAAGVVDEHGRVLVRRRVDSPAESAEALVAAVCALVTDLAADGPVTGVGLSVAGFVDIDAGVVVTAPNLAWRDLPLRDLVAQRTGLPVLVDNDGNAAAWGERVFGAGRGVDEMVLVSVGTGIGGGIVTGGELRHGAHGMAAEIGHLTLVPGGEPCGCGRRGCWERYASGPALERLAAETDWGSAGDTGARSTGPELLALADAGDPTALALFTTLGERLGQGVASLIAVLDPAVVVLGGGVAAAGDLLLASTREAVLADLPGGTGRPAPEIVLATLGNDAGMIGAAHLAALNVEGAP